MDVPVVREEVEQEAGRAARERKSIATRIGDSAAALALVVLAIGVALFFSVLPETGEVFPTVENLQVLFGGQAVLALATLAVLVPLICNEFDLSVGANLSLAGVLCASAMSSGAPLWVGFAIAIGSGMAVGVINGLLVTRAHINGVVATLGMATVMFGVVQAKTKGVPITEGIPAPLLDLGSETWFEVPRILIAAVVAASLLFYLLEHTPFGRQLYMLGANREAARLVGIRTDWLLFMTFVIGGALAGLAGILQVGRAGSAVPSVGDTFLLPAFAAAFLSAAAIKPGRFNVWGAIVAISFLTILNGGLNLAGAENYISNFVNGIALIIGVGLVVWLARRRRPALRPARPSESTADKSAHAAMNRDHGRSKGPGAARHGDDPPTDRVR